MRRKGSKGNGPVNSERDCHTGIVCVSMAGTGFNQAHVALADTEASGLGGRVIKSDAGSKATQKT